MNHRPLIAICLVLGLAGLLRTHAADAVPSLSGWWNGEQLTGPWGGARPRLADHGVTLFAEWTADSLWNTTGGMQTGYAFMDVVEFGFDVDLETATGGWWRGGTFRASALHNGNTRLITTDLVGDLNGVSNIEAPRQTRLYELWLAQTLFEDALTLQLGNMIADADFAVADFAGALINSGFGWSQFVAATTAGLVPAYPFAAPGFRVAWEVSDSFYFQAAVYDGDALDSELHDLESTDGGWNVRVNGEGGGFFIGEAGWCLNTNEDDDGLQGSYFIGGFYHSGVISNLYEDVNGGAWIVTGEPPETYPGIWGVYVGINQLLHRDSDSGREVGMFVRAAGLPKDRSYVNLSLDAGLTFTGWIPGRKDDVTSIGYIYTSISPLQALTESADQSANGAPPAPLSDYEMVIELTHRLQLNHWWHVQPDVQFIIHPGGSAALQNSFVAGFRTGLTF